jgi:hypothetical protein
MLARNLGLLEMDRGNDRVRGEGRVIDSVYCESNPGAVIGCGERE